MNYYDKVLMESNVELYVNRLQMAMDILESYGINLSDNSKSSSYNVESISEDNAHI